VARIRINGISYDPDPDDPGARAAARSADASTSNYILVQTRGPLTEDQKDRLRDLGIVVHEYVPDDTYLCAYAPADLDAIRRLPFVAFAGIYRADLKIAPTLRGHTSAERTASAALDRSPSRPLRDVDLVLHDNVDGRSDEVRARIAAAARRDPDDLPYDSSSREIDETVWTHQDLVICFAAGNDGIDRNRNSVVDAGSVGAEAAAKNCITVGASESLRGGFAPTYGGLWPDDYPAAPLGTDRLADAPDGMVAFSSRGPTKESRIKPDVVAPGTCILSTLSRDVAIAPTKYGVSTDPLFYFSSGTSMATPLVAGCVAALREVLVKNGMQPSAALVKALLVNGAVELPGQYSPSEAGPSLNTDSGFGRVDLGRSVAIALGTGDSGFREAGPLAQGEQEVFTVDVPADGRQHGLKATLVWTDPPGAALQNDLDLIVRAGGQERHGNAGTSARFDRVNNVEQVTWTGIPTGTIRVLVRSFRITLFPQPYAVAWQIL
jgi:hypothetical protein